MELINVERLLIYLVVARKLQIPLSPNPPPFKFGKLSSSSCLMWCCFLLSHGFYCFGLFFPLSWGSNGNSLSISKVVVRFASTLCLPRPRLCGITLGMLSLLLLFSVDFKFDDWSACRCKLVHIPLRLIMFTGAQVLPHLPCIKSVWLLLLMVCSRAIMPLFLLMVR